MSGELQNDLDEQSTDSNELGCSNVKETHPIAEAIDCFLHSARDTKWSYRIFGPAAAKLMSDRIEEAVGQIQRSDELLKSHNSFERIHGMKEMQKAIRKLKRLHYSRPPEVIDTSLFLSLFSKFDAYSGELLTAIYERKPELYGGLDISVKLIDVLNANSIGDFRRSVLEGEIENFRRKSYVEQFIDMEKRFKLPLREFNGWADFVECTQRRNLLTHCGGIVSGQYIKICKQEKYPEEKIPPLGSKLKLERQYVLATCELMIEVGLSLGQTLWRKIFPAELEVADEHLHRTQFDALESHNWGRAKVFGKFAVGQTKNSGEVDRRIRIINYCIALKFSGDEVTMLKELDKSDWSASINDFRLSEAVLRDQFKEAADIMLRIGKEGEMVNETAYPIFNIHQ